MKKRSLSMFPFLALFGMSCSLANYSQASGLNATESNASITHHRAENDTAIAAPRKFRENCEASFIQRSSSDLEHATSVNGTTLELAQNQRFLVVQCINHGERCLGINHQNFESRCETKLSRQRALARPLSKSTASPTTLESTNREPAFREWEIKLPGFCICAIAPKR